MRKQLDGLRWETCWMTEVGCLKGCLAHLGVEITLPHLYGLSAYAFVINMHEVACPSSPTAWRSADLVAALLPNLGAQAEFALGSTETGGLAEAQANAWELARRYLDAGLPVYGWELHWPEYYVVHGYDHVGYYYRGPGCEDGGGPKPWQELGATEIGMVYVAGLKPCPRTSTQAAVADALEVALQLAEPDNPWRLENYTTGPAAYDVWANALASGIASEFGHRYCASVWAEGRHHAVRFLTELAESLQGAAGEAAQEALAAYRRVNVLLGTVAQEHVFLPYDQIPEGQTLQSAESASMLRQAGEAETEGLTALRKLAEALRG
ncbi:BtrH N-terminal domain-containing protein [bacterium]|nr:BtrH N-terminal domain-containing protein [bacterium]